MSDTDVTGRSGGMDEDLTEAVETLAGSTAAVDDDAVSDPEAGPVGMQDELSDEENDENDESEESEDEDDESEDDEDEDDTVSENSARRTRRAPSLKRLEEEGEVAADYLEELLDITDLDGDIDIDVENGRASVAVVAEEEGNPDLRRLVGSRGEVLEALQELTRLAVQARTGERSRLMLDVAGFRAARRRALEIVAAKACDEVATGGKPVRLDPMSAFERKVVHDVVAGAGLRSESEGEEPSRRVVVFPVSV